MVTPFACSVQLSEEVRCLRLCRPNVGFHFTVEYLIRLEIVGKFRFFTNVLVDFHFCLLSLQDGTEHNLPFCSLCLYFGFLIIMASAFASGYRRKRKFHREPFMGMRFYLALYNKMKVKMEALLCWGHLALKVCLNLRQRLVPIPLYKSQ